MCYHKIHHKSSIAMLHRTGRTPLLLPHFTSLHQLGTTISYLAPSETDVLITKWTINHQPSPVVRVPHPISRICIPRVTHPLKQKQYQQELSWLSCLLKGWNKGNKLSTFSDQEDRILQWTGLPSHETTNEKKKSEFSSNNSKTLPKYIFQKRETQGVIHDNTAMPTGNSEIDHRQRSSTSKSQKGPFPNKGNFVNDHLQRSSILKSQRGPFPNNRRINNQAEGPRVANCWWNAGTRKFYI